MTLAEAYEHADLLASVEAGTATAEDVAAALPILAELASWVSDVNDKALRYSKAMALLADIAPDRIDAVKAALAQGERVKG